jgi:acetyl esterase/lipase
VGSKFGPQAEYLASRGMLTARVEHRVHDTDDTFMEEGVEDAKSAVRFLRKNAAEFRVNPDRIAVAGGSAAALIALCTCAGVEFDATDEDLGISSKANLLVLFNPLVDLVERGWSGKCRHPETSAPLLSPALTLNAITLPTLIIYSSGDLCFGQGLSYLKSARTRCADCRFFVLRGANHGFFNREPWLSMTLRLTDQFLAMHGYLEGESPIPVPDDSRVVEVATSGGILYWRVSLLVDELAKRIGVFVSSNLKRWGNRAAC